MCWNMKITQIFRLGVNALDVKVHALDVEITFLSNDPQSSSSSSSLSVPSWADEIAKDIITITGLLFRKVFKTLSREENFATVARFKNSFHGIIFENSFHGRIF